MAENRRFAPLVVIGFLAGAISVFVFHQGFIFIGWRLGMLPNAPYSLEPTAPLGVPRVISSAFWGGLWGIAAAFLVPRLPGALHGVLGWILFAAIVVALANWFVVQPIKGGGAFRMPVMPWLVVLPLVYGLWGFGMWLIAGALRTTLRWR